VRGVAVNPNIVKTLMERDWIRVVGQRDVPGRPELLGTTREFLDYFSLRSIEELPPLAELRSMADLNLQLPLPVADDIATESGTALPDIVADEIEADEPEAGGDSGPGLVAAQSSHRE